MRKILSPLFSLVTVVGGHFLNRRLDLGLLFFSGFFHETVRYGGKWVSLDKLETMPKGEAFLTGRVRYEGRPAVGLTLRMVIDSRYLSDQLTTDATEVAFSNFETIPDMRGGSTEYAVRVYAFDENDELIGSSGGFFEGRSFVLREESIVETDELRSMGNLSGLSAEARQDQIESRYRDKKRLAAARTLIAEGLIDSARVVLERVEAAAFERDKMTVSGMILASEGRCEEARTLLDEVSERRGGPCYPEIFTELCETTAVE